MDPHGQSSPHPARRPPALPDALRIQIAAVAAQQAANDHQETRLAERRAALEQEVAHLEDKRRQLLLLSERVANERAALEQKRQTDHQEVGRVAADLTQPLRDLLERERRVQAERDRLARLQRKLKRRWHAHWQRKQQDYARRQQAQTRLAAELAQRQGRVEELERTLREQRLRFNGDAELARLHIQETWGNLRQAQFRWKQRRGLERAALRVRRRELEIAAQKIAQARAQLAHDQRSWLAQRQALELELEGVNTRIQNQREVLGRQEALILRLDHQIHHQAAGSISIANQQADNSDPAAVVASLPARVLAAAELVEAVRCGRGAESQEHERTVDLDRMAQDLADQRGQLVEAWERAAAEHDRWQADRSRALAELEAMGARLLERDLLVQAREQAGAQADDVLRQRHQELLRLHEQVIAWRARLHIEENAWHSDKARTLAELRSKDAAAEQHLAMLVELRQRWATRRKQELDELERERNTLETFRKECARLRAELVKRATSLEQESRVIAEKQLALDHYHEQTLRRAGEDPQAQQRLERLRRRWVTQNAEALRNLSRQRTALHAELKAIERRYDGLNRRAAEVAAAESELTQQQTAWDQQRLLLQAQHTRLQSDLQIAQEQRLLAEQQVAAMRDEVERIARALLDEPTRPLLSIDQAA